MVLVPLATVVEVVPSTVTLVVVVHKLSTIDSDYSMVIVSGTVVGVTGITINNIIVIDSETLNASPP